MEKMNLKMAALLWCLLATVACGPAGETATATETPMPVLAKVTEEQYDVRNDSLIFTGATIENFSADGRSTELFWINERRDTILRLYRKYDAEQQPIGAEYYEEGDTLPNLDTLYTDEAGRRVEASLNADRQVTWMSTIYTDDRGNEVLRSYQNSKGEYRGLDSLYYDERNRVVKGFYENAKGKRKRIKTYEYLRDDAYANWLERTQFVNDTLRQKHLRQLEYYE